MALPVYCIYYTSLPSLPLYVWPHRGEVRVVGHWCTPFTTFPMSTPQLKHLHVHVGRFGFHRNGHAF